MSCFTDISERLNSHDLVTVLKAVAESTRLRILLLLRAGELNVKDLMQILGQSQPRLSRHLKLLYEAGLLERFREGSWVYFRLSERARFGELGDRLTLLVNPADPTIARDRERMEALKQERERSAQAYFEAHAGDWDRIRSLHISEVEVEAAMRDVLEGATFDTLVDLGTGTGRTLELFANSYQRAIGFDVNQSMLAYARTKISQAGLRNAQVRHGDIYNLALEAGEGDVVVMHQILHFLSDPGGALVEAGRVIKPGGRLLIVDFAPHQMEFLRDKHAHERLGFSTEQVTGWLERSGLELEQTRALAPKEQGTDALTVMVWLAKKPAVETGSGEPSATNSEKFLVEI
ncbi:MAG: metalloregulator ArsR/SmtB family transcription factor [Alphaproteobacteria bacterium]|nr:metalloregulator ArsR/SmtB family transcription factor [Alphaproteobacteria bacterium]